MYDLFNPVPNNIKTIADLSKVMNDIATVPGLSYISDFLTQADEEFLTDKIKSGVWLTDIKRRVQHYGYKYDYKARGIDYSMFLGPLPSWIQPIAKRLCSEGYFAEEPDQVIINEYTPGQGITNHVDCQPCFGETIVSISLGAYCIMDFINLVSKRKIEILLEPRSIVAISGEARHNWSHGIPQRKTDSLHGFKFNRQIRLSMTFRKVILQ
jgi:alkylated DNA repair dioxygenase AlkB